MNPRIAVIGLGCLFPGAKSPQQFWQNLIEQRDSRTEVTDEDIGLPVRSGYDPRKGVPDKFYCPYGGYVRGFEMDPSGFRVSEETVLGLDHVFQWSLHVAREALRDAGYLGRREALERCGVLLGNLSMPTPYSNQLILPIYHRAVETCLQELLEDEAFRLAPFAPPVTMKDDNWKTSGHPSAVIAEALCLGGRHFSLDAACASSLYSVKLACDYLLSRKADMMLAGAVSAADPLFVHTGFSIFQAYPEEGSPSSPLDKRSGGLIAGQGAGMFVLKRLGDALRDRDRIYATILGTGLSNDGRGQSVLSPNPKGQMFAFERAYENARVDPRDVDFVECHATGTVLGDRIELDSMDAFFGRHGASPLVGAVKSNIGHLLTAAGMASMTKVLLAMMEGTIPPTIHLEEPQSSSNQVVSVERIPRQNRPWPDGKTGRRGAASAFGLGGTNAHIIFERGEDVSGAADRQEGDRAARHDREEPLKPAPMAIVGMDAFFGPCEGLAAFHRSIYEGTQHFIPLPPGRWKGIEREASLLKEYGFEEARPPEGAYIDSFELDFMRFKIPPNEDDRLIPQHLLLLRVADKALQQTGVRKGENVAVIVAMETELSLHETRGRIGLAPRLERSLSGGAPTLSEDRRRELTDIVKNSIHGPGTVNRMTSFIGNIMASRVSAAWDFSGPAFTVSSDENSVFKALEIAQMMIQNDEVEAVVVGAVDLCGGVESVLLRNRHCRSNTTGPRTLSFDRNVKSWTVGEGAGAVVLRRREKAADRGERIYANVDAIGFSNGTDGRSVEEACRRALEGADAAPGAVGYLEVFGSGVPEEDEAERVGLTRAYSGAGQGPACAIGSAKATVGHTFAASGMASLIKAALCLHHRFIPGTPMWTGPEGPHLPGEDVFYVPAQSKTWFLEQGRAKRRAAVSGLGRDGVAAHLILSEEAVRPDVHSDYLAEALPLLLPVSGNDRRALQQELDRIKKDLVAGVPPATVAGACFERHGRNADAEYGAGIVGCGTEDLLREIDSMRTGLEKAFEEGRDWSSLRGSCFTTRPQGREGRIAFVYPGGLTSYPGLGRDLFQLFPDMFEHAARYSSRLGDMVADELLYPRSLEGLSNREWDDREKALLENPIAMFESGILFSILYTKIVTEIFRLRPHMALGYSMGEVSMMFALGVWDEADRMSRALRDSPLFRTRLAGPMQTLRDAWDLSPEEGERGRIWHCHAVRDSADRVREALKDERRAYLIFVNTPKEVILAGDEGACGRVIERLGCEHLAVPMSDVIHCPIARAEYDELVRVHTLPVHEVSGTAFYSADRFAPLPLDQETIAKNIAEIYCHEIDFPKLVGQTYRDGARVFVEVGPRENCTHWIGEILREKPHLAVGTNRKGVDDKTSIVRALARLFSHRVALDLARLYSRTEPTALSGKSLVKTTTLGGTHIPSVILDKKQRGRFKRTPAPAEPGAPEDRAGTVLPFPPGREEATEVHLSSGFDLAGVVEPEGARPTGEPRPSALTPSGLERFYGHLSRAGSSHAAFLQTRREGMKQIGETIRLQLQLAARGGFDPAAPRVGPEPHASSPPRATPEPRHGSAPRPPLEQSDGTPTWEALQEISRQGQAASRSIFDPARRPDVSDVVWDYADLREFAEGSIAKVFGEDYSIIDTYGRRVRLPMEPYLLVTRVTKLDAQAGVFRPCSMTTEYDVPHDAWYSMGGQVPWAVAVEAGQCDLLLISYLGIDFECKGERVYRLLDCTMTFLGEIAKAGETLRYDIRINSFARTGGTLLFFFEYDCYVKGKRILEMRGGCAGFFTDEELDAGRGIIRTEQEIEERSRIRPQSFAPLLSCERSSFERRDLVALAGGDKAACFGPAHDPKGRNPWLHFSTEAMLMLDRVVSVDPGGGPWGLGLVIAEKDLVPDHWYFPCHFKDDPVLAGSLMAEGCGQLLRFFILYMGLQTCTKDALFQPVPDRPQKVRCRGQVTPKHTLLTYRMEIKAVGTTPRPYALADVDIIVDDKVVVDFKDLGVLLAEQEAESPRLPVPNETAARTEPGSGEVRFTKDHLREFATGSLAKCFGQAFSVYEDRRPPRLPSGDLQLIDRVRDVSGNPLDTNGRPQVIAECDIPEDAWYLRDSAHPALVPNAILMELSLQPCLFVSAYAGTPLLKPHTDLCFRALEGEGTLLREVDLRGETVTTRSTLLSTAAAGDTIIQRFEFVLAHDRLPFFQGTAVCGYFPPTSLGNPVGPEAGEGDKPGRTKPYPSDDPALRIDLKSSSARKRFFTGRTGKPFYRLGGSRLELLDEVHLLEKGGNHQQGFVHGVRRIDPRAWFFPLHFQDDPVMPGSLGIEAVLQAVQVFALQRDLGAPFDSPRFAHPLDHRTAWKLHGQILPQDERMTVEVHIKKIEGTRERVILVGDGSLWKNGIRLYEITDAAVCLVEDRPERDAG